MKIDRFPMLYTCLFLSIQSALRYCADSILVCANIPGQSFSFFLATAPKDCIVSFAKHDAPFRSTEKCWARWTPHTIILNDITDTETRQTWQSWWLCPALFANGKLPYSSIDFYTANLCVALSVCEYYLCCQVFRFPWSFCYFQSPLPLIITFIYAHCCWFF